MVLSKIKGHLLRALKRRTSTPPIKQEQGLGPRLLSEIENDWVKVMLKASVGWENADISKTSVARVEPNPEGFLVVLDAPAAENPHAAAVMNSYAQLWIETADHLIVNVLLHESEGRLKSFYVIVVDPKHPRRRVNIRPKTWIELSRNVVGFGS
ncbi:hypothetical protein [Acidipila sp. EB88]|uniref:hypothetical protein n=1 Tax=Acidipila sp. EB88 TaxID=2305226 RepID=UPI000F5D6278|nr:hypothetical protein [Acidipila sp. EB88]